MKKCILSAIALVCLAMPCFAQEGLVDRVSALERKIDALGSKIDSLLAASPKSAIAKCACEIRDGVCVCHPATALPFAPPVQYLQTWGQAGGGSCANGSCGSSGGFRLFGRRR